MKSVWFPANCELIIFREHLRNVKDLDREQSE